MTEVMRGVEAGKMTLQMMTFNERNFGLSFGMIMNKNVRDMSLRIWVITTFHLR